MLTLAVETLVEVVAGQLVTGSEDAMVNGLVTDSRDVDPGMAFVAFRGVSADGHDHLEQAVSHGARALIVTRSPGDIAAAVEVAERAGIAVVRVPDALKAVQALAAHHRDRLFCPVIGVTGSTGKTTTKDFITSVLSTRLRVTATLGNQNNELGVPLTLIRAGADTDVLVVEMAMRGSGQIAQLCEIARPTMGLVTNVGTSHIELLGSEEAIASAKGELVEAVPPEGMVFLNSDDVRSAPLADRARAQVVLYGLGEECEICARDVTVDADSRPSFELVTPGGTRRVTLAIPGRHNVYNALAAAAVARNVGVPLDDIISGLESAEITGMRMQVFESATGIHVINDAYNANPTSMRAAVETLAGMSVAGRRVAVLGDMAELGSLAELAHFHIGEEIARSGIDTLVTVGELGARFADGARAAGMDTEAIRPCVTVDEASEVLDDLLSPGDVVLVKASRVMGLERVVEAIVEPHV
ncbi:MAG: UDP-N-acetylmuramoyl-tripeptide--D-alanyl-D-alanine ligase [Actinomycetota bacterium]|nr:UDP-N-acetylmuramoyl-tripeptide--D-alanyl-D-alanine ligase [Actinomycetota bacterium]